MSELNQECTALEQNLIPVKAPYRTAHYSSFHRNTHFHRNTSASAFSTATRFSLLKSIGLETLTR